MRGSLSLAERLDAGALGVVPDAGTVPLSCLPPLLPPLLLARSRAASSADEDDAGGAAVGALQAALQDQQRRLSVACAQTAEYASASRWAEPRGAAACFFALLTTPLRRHRTSLLTYRARLRAPGSKEEEAKALLSQARRWLPRFSCAASRCARAAP